MFKRLFLFPVLLAGMALPLVLAQPPEGGKKGPPGGRDRRMSPEVEAWVKTLSEKIADPHDEIRDSARAALVAIGRPALPVLNGLTEGDGAKAGAARKVIEQIESKQTARGDGAMRMPGGPDRPNPMEALIDELGLNDKVRKQVDDLQKEMREKQRELQEAGRDGKMDREEARAKRRELQEGMLKKMKELLDAEQFAKFEEGMRNLPRPMPPEGGPRPPQ